MKSKLSGFSLTPDLSLPWAHLLRLWIWVGKEAWLQPFKFYPCFNLKNTYLNFLHLSFLICNMGTQTFTLKCVVRIK